MKLLAALELTRGGKNEFWLDKMYVVRVLCRKNGSNCSFLAGMVVQTVYMKRSEWKKSTNFGDFQPFFVIFSPISSLSHIYYTNSEDKSAITWFSWSQWRLKLFTSAQGGLPPPTQLTNRNIQRWEISVSWVGQSTRGLPTWELFPHNTVFCFWRRP